MFKRLTKTEDVAGNTIETVVYVNLDQVSYISPKHAVGGGFAGSVLHYVSHEGESTISVIEPVGIVLKPSEVTA